MKRILSIFSFQRSGGLAVLFLSATFPGLAQEPAQEYMKIPEPAVILESNSVFMASPPPVTETTRSAFHVSDPLQADTGKAMRKKAAQEIPWQELSPQVREKVRSVLSNQSMYRRLPIQTVPCEEDLFEFITRHPDVVVNLWQVMEISKIQLKEIGTDKFYMEDQAGTRGIMECIYRGNRYMLIHVLGTYEGVPFPRKVTGSGVLILQYLPVVNTAGQKQLAIRLDAFMQIDNNGVDFLARTFQPMVGKVADNNFCQTVGFMGVLSRTVCYNGRGMKEFSQRLDKVRPEVREAFGNLSLAIYLRTEQQWQSHGPLPVPVETAKID
ncbi:MAG: hypothetical protein Q4D62_11055 [Planctomycetia bacterium]|nr:hypothetical protein [Planctomycetia bacterium]